MANVQSKTMSPYERAMADMAKAAAAHVKAVTDYNIMMGVLEDPAEEEETDEWTLSQIWTGQGLLRHRRMEEKGYKEQTINILETIKNNNCKDGYAIMGLSKKGLKKLGSGELNELNIPETYQGKNIEIIMQACAYNGETGVPYNNIKKVNIPDSVKIIFENAFSDYSPETEFNYNKEGKYAPDEAFPQ